MSKPLCQYTEKTGARIGRILFGLALGVTICGLPFTIWQLIHAFQYKILLYPDRLVCEPFSQWFQRTLPLTSETKVGISWVEDGEEHEEYSPWVVVETPGHKQMSFKGSTFSTYREMAKQIAQQTGKPLQSVAPKTLFSTFTFRD